MQNFLQSDGKQVVTDSGEICTLSVVKDSDKLTVIATNKDGYKFKPRVDSDLTSSSLRFYGTELLLTFAIDLNSQSKMRFRNLIIINMFCRAVSTLFGYCHVRRRKGAGKSR